MAIITKGLGSPALVTSGYGWFSVIVEKIVKVISHLLPKKRRKIFVEIPVEGNPLFPIEVPVFVAGSPFEYKELFLPVEGNLSMSFKLENPVVGSLFSLVGNSYPIDGILSEKVTVVYECLGNISYKFSLQLHCEGKKDFKKIIWELVEDEN